MYPGRPWRLGLWQRPAVAVVDVALIAVLTALAILGHVRDPEQVPAIAAAFSICACLALAGRHRYPIAAVWVSAVAGVLSTLLSDDGVALLPAAIVAGSVVASGRRRAGIVGAAALAVGLELALFVRNGGTWPESDTYELSAVPLVLALAVATGLAIDYRRRSIQALLDRARSAEETRDAETRRAVAEERVRIARELHDVVAHHVAVVGVQAGSAEHLIDLDPVAARAAITQVRQSSGDVLRELATLLDLLRSSDEDARAPAPSIARLDQLVEGLTRSGLDVEVEITGSVRELAPVVDMAAYRLAQESLTNAHKHGDGSARLTLSYLPDRLVLEVHNRVGADGTDSDGYGIVGMSERATAVGGTLETGVVGDEYVVRADLPAVQIAGGER